MIDFPNPIDPFEHVKVPKIEPETDTDQEKKTKFIPKPVSKKLFLYLNFLKILSNSLKLLRANKKFDELEKTPIYKELLTIKTSLESLEKKDLSQDSEFLNFFAFIWLKFFKDYESYFLKNTETINLIEKLMHQINSYPENTKFTLGYYISEFAGHKWVPYPYMQILKNLHIENKKNPNNSHLKNWIDILNTLLKKI